MALIHEIKNSKKSRDTAPLKGQSHQIFYLLIFFSYFEPACATGQQEKKLDFCIHWDIQVLSLKNVLPGGIRPREIDSLGVRFLNLKLE